MAAVVKPTVLISSTIYDFADLRSSLRYWLSEFGYDVLLSEFNDFPKFLEDNSYESCLKAIEKADYFILLIGARTGGWFDKKKGISITRREFQEALKLFRERGKPRLAVFVRKNLWDIREDRAALKRYMKKDQALCREFDEETKEKLVKHPSCFVNDANATFEFLQEVGQVDEMKKATTGEGGLPKGNWIHQFSQFSDIAIALRTTFDVKDNLEREILRENLKQELLRNLRHLMYKSNKGIMPISDWALSIAQKIGPSINGESVLRVRDLNRLVIFRIAAVPVPHRLDRLFVQQAAELGLFMHFDLEHGRYVSSKAHEVLLELLGLISSIRRRDVSSQELPAFLKKFNLRGRDSEETINVQNIEIAISMSEANVFNRIVELSACLLHWINDDPIPLNMIPSWTSSPFFHEAEQMRQEEVRIEDVISWLAKPKHLGYGRWRQEKDTHD